MSEEDIEYRGYDADDLGAFEKREQNAIHRIANKTDVWHLIQRGQLVQHHFDLEASGLNTKFDQIYSYGDAIGDIAGNLIDWEEIEVKRPERNFPSPQSLLVTRTDIDEIDEEGRLPHRIAMGKILQRFENADMMIARLKGLRERDISYTRIRMQGETKHPNYVPNETVLEYPLKDESGEISYDVRIHPERGMYSYRLVEDRANDLYESTPKNYYEDEDGSKWVFIRPSTVVSGYRIKWYDISLLRHNLLRAGLHPSNSFFAFSQATLTDKQLRKKTAVDTYSVVTQAYLHDDGGEDGLNIGNAIDRRSGESASSRKLELILGNNSRYKNTIRGVPEGIFMPHNKAIYDRLRAHKSPAYDALASFAAYNYSREINPDIVREVELQADEKYLREYLPGLDLSNPHAPIYSIGVNSYPDEPKSVPVIFAGFDDQYGKLNQAIMLRADGDLRYDRYPEVGDKTLKEIAAEHHKLPDSRLHESPMVKLLRAQGYGPDALVRRESIRRWGAAVPLQDALNTRAMEHWDPTHVLDHNFNFILSDKNQDILDAIRESVGVVNWEFRMETDPENPMLEEQWGTNGFGDLDYLETEAREERYRREKEKSMPTIGQPETIVETLYEKASSIYDHHKAVDTKLHELILQPHPIEWAGELDHAAAEEALESFNSLFRKTYAYFRERNYPYQHIFDDYLATKRNGESYDPPRVRKLGFYEAQQFRRDMMHRLLNDDMKEKASGKSVRGQSYVDGVFDYEYTDKGRILFGNCTRNFRIVDENNRELSIDYIKQQYAQHPSVVFDKLEDKSWRIQFYRLTSEPSVTATLMQFADAGRLDELPPLWQFRYEALERLYLNGAPSDQLMDAEDKDLRWAGLAQLEKSLKRIEVNAPADKVKALAAIFSSSVAAGDAELFLNSDEGVRFLQNYRRRLEEVKTAKPFEPVHARALNWEPDSGIAFNKHKLEVNADDVVVIDVPDTHIRRPLQEIRLSPNAVFIKKISQKNKRRIRRGAEVLLRGEQTGRLYATGPVNTKPAPSETGSYAREFERAARAYNDAGSKFPKADRREILIFQEAVPVADPDVNVDWNAQAVKVPNEYFDGLVAPRLAHFNDDEPFTSLVLPVDYCPQNFEEDQTIRFREMNTPMGAKVRGEEKPETGHTYETTLRGVQRMRVSDLQNLDEETARRSGYAGSLDMLEKVSGAFLRRESPDPYKEEVFVLTFDQVDKKSWKYLPVDVPEAVLIRQGMRVPPSVFSWDSEGPLMDWADRSKQPKRKPGS